MKARQGYDWKEYGFLMLLAVLCTVVAILQFRWTGELAKAEFQRLGGDQNERASRFAEAFDHELSASVQAILPNARQLKEKSIAAKIAHWQEKKPLPIFRRIGLALVGESGLALSLIDPVSGKMTAASWPEEWSALESTLAEKAEGFGAPYMGGDGMIFEYPIYATNPKTAGKAPGGPGGPGAGRGGPGGPPREEGWIIFELDSDYLGSTWLPALAKQYINPGEQGFYRTTVTTDDGATLLGAADHGTPEGNLEEPVSVVFHRKGRSQNMRAGGPPGNPEWTLTIQRESGELEAMVASSRKRNLILAFAVNGLILAAGIALVRHTHRSRVLAQSQMDFVANVSHELRTPVTVILGAAHNLKRGIVSSPEAVERYAGMIQKHGQQLSEMVQEVLEFSAARKGGAAYKKVPLEIEEVLRAAVEDIKEDTATCELELSVAEGLPRIQGEPGALRRVFMNLIGNAAKHGGGGWIGISAKRAGNQVEISISDRGPGVPKGEQGRIFEPFFRGEEARGKQTRGSGLGLGLVKEITEAHGGRVSLSSEPGHGATFIISLPIGVMS